MIESVVALLMFVNAEIKEARLQENMATCLRGKRHAERILVGLTPEFFRCITCGADLQQHINGKISYIPTLTPKTLKSNLDKYFDGKKV
jgi:hypothetical protein